MTTPKGRGRPRLATARNKIFKGVTFTSRQIEFMRQLCYDISYVDIAKKMGQSVRTIEGYRDDLFKKLHVRSRIGLVIWTLKAGIVDLKKIKL